MEESLPMLHSVMIAGGSGTRFWPASRKEKPKQFLVFQGKQTLLQQTWDRCAHWIPPERSWVVTGSAFAAETRSQLPELHDDRLLLEPVGRNTAPAIGLAAIHLLKQDPNAIMLVMPADHHVHPSDEFQFAAKSMTQMIKHSPETLLLFGAQPTYPATGYGYLQTGTALGLEPQFFQVEQFHEKPDAKQAEAYLERDDTYWNCGIFLWDANRILHWFEQLKPTMYEQLMKISDAIGQENYQQVLNENFPQMESISIDYAILEHATKVFMVQSPFQWDDLGGWNSLSRQFSPDNEGNILQGNVCSLETKECIIKSEENHLIATYGIENLIIIQTADATLIVDRKHEEAMRELVKSLEEQGCDDVL